MKWSHCELQKLKVIATLHQSFDHWIERER